MSQSGTFPAGKTYPFDVASGQQAGNAEWRHYGTSLGDGIVNDVAGNAFGVTPSGSDRTIVVTLNELRVRGIHFEGVSATTTITLSAVASGFTRADRIVAHYDPTDKSIAIVKHEGSAVNTGSPVLPALDRNSGGTWDLPLWHFVGGNVSASLLTMTDDRTWLGWAGFAANLAALSDVAPVGSQFLVLDTAQRYRRIMVLGVPTWVNMDRPTWAAIPLPSSVVPSGQTPQWAVMGGIVYLRGGYAPTAGGNFAAGGGTGGAFSLGTLPAGARPGASIAVPAAFGLAVSALAGVRLNLNTAGVLTGNVITNDVSAIRIDGVTFPAEN